MVSGARAPGRVGVAVARRAQSASRTVDSVPADSGGEQRSLGREASSVCLGLVAGLIALAIFTYEPGARENAFGPLGVVLADILVQSLGLASLLVPVALFGLAWAVYRGVLLQICGKVILACTPAWCDAT